MEVGTAFHTRARACVFALALLGFGAEAAAARLDLRLVAETIDVDVDTLRTLNPSLLRMVTPDDSGFVLHLPKGTSERFSAEIADIPADKWVSWRRHRVEAGESLFSLAKKYHVTAPAIAAAMV